MLNDYLLIKWMSQTVKWLVEMGVGLQGYSCSSLCISVMLMLSEKKPNDTFLTTL